ncbi:MAG: chaperone modulator CbpM [Paludibacter sp.]|nr:chaperone modulator CbpM [Paludibacter sp.]
MQTDNLIAIDKFCAKHDIELSFVSSLQQIGLIEITTIEDGWYIHTEQLQQLEKFIRFYYELDINLEGIETINHLLGRITELQDELTLLRNKLGLYE